MLRKCGQHDKERLKQHGHKIIRGEVAGGIRGWNDREEVKLNTRCQQKQSTKIKQEVTKQGITNWGKGLSSHKRKPLSSFSKHQGQNNTDLTENQVTKAVRKKN